MLSVFRGDPSVAQSACDAASGMGIPQSLRSFGMTMCLIIGAKKGAALSS
jgi:hypothetical protein